MESPIPGSTTKRQLDARDASLLRCQADTGALADRTNSHPTAVDKMHKRRTLHIGTL
jgi:hypothetical protein